VTEDGARTGRDADLRGRACGRHRANAYRGFADLLTNGSPGVNLMILNAAIYCTQVVQDIVVVG
jgi:hypothetical protein